jgi:ribose/xylose/arabinose/galactoside ABC-type transport system permease subunit
VALNGVLAMGMVFVITAGGIDLSIGAMLALSSTFIGIICRPPETRAGLPGSIAVCTLFGMINGLLIAKFNMFPFVVRWRAAGQPRHGTWFRAATPSRGQPRLHADRLGKLFKTIPYPILILLGITILAYLILHWTRFGRYVYSVGGNVGAAKASGVNVFWTQASTYIISGFCAGVAGIIMTARINAAQPNIGIGYETDAIAACVIGGTSFAGGISTIPGTLVGIIIIGLIYNGMNLVGVSSYWQMIWKGLLIIGAVMIDTLLNKRKR